MNRLRTIVNRTIRCIVFSPSGKPRQYHNNVFNVTKNTRSDVRVYVLIFLNIKWTNNVRYIAMHLNNVQYLYTSTLCVLMYTYNVEYTVQCMYGFSVDDDNANFAMIKRYNICIRKNILNYQSESYPVDWILQCDCWLSIVLAYFSQINSYAMRWNGPGKCSTSQKKEKKKEQFRNTKNYSITI